MIEQSQFRHGHWTGRLRAGSAPKLSVSLHGEPLQGVSVEPAGEGLWQIGFAVPPAALSDGAHSFLIDDAETGQRLGVATIIAGVGLEEDLRAELDVIRAELDMLKRTLRRLASGG